MPGWYLDFTELFDLAPEGEEVVGVVVFRDTKEDPVAISRMVDEGCPNCEE